ncbi:hypothetical protein [Clostridium sp. DL1XJH146]
MNKKGKLFFVLGILFFMIGFAAVMICSGNEKLDIPLTMGQKILVGAIGVIFDIGGVIFLALHLTNFTSNDENLKIEEKDERNIMIRGKAAEMSMLITIFMMLTVNLILICIGDTTAALLVAIPLFICGFLQMLLICYYQKKY